MTPDLKELAAVKADRDDWKARAAAAEAELAREGEAVAKVVLTKTLGLPTMQWLGLDKQFDLADGQLLYTTPPQPAAQEPPSAVPVVEQLVEALEKHHAEATRYSTAKNRANATCAEFKTSPLSELAEQGYMLSLGKETVAAIAAGQQYLKENGK